jgi:hypothetical protein
MYIRCTCTYFRQPKRLGFALNSDKVKAKYGFCVILNKSGLIGFSGMVFRREAQRPSRERPVLSHGGATHSPARRFVSCQG